MAKNLLVCANSLSALKKINESEGNQQSYFLEGVFAELDTLNRNKRIYPKDEYLKHLSYLRDDLKKGEPLLGELDHPEDRFEVKLKEASHKIVDLWYDANTNCVMGKIELLNTPNGKLAQSLVDQGIPLHISSRAAGTVGNDSKVSIQQIYTYDLVCKPGFAGAVLHRVNESDSDKKYDSETNKFLEESNRMESLNTAPQFGINENEVSIREVSYSATLRKEAAEIKENDNIDNMEQKKNVEEVDENKIDSASNNNDTQPVLEDNGSEDENSDDKNKDNDNSDDEKSDDSDDENGVKIISVRAVTDEDDVDIKDVKSDDSDDDKNKDDNSDDEKSDDSNDSDDSDDDSKNEEKTDECENKEGSEESKGCDDKKCDPKKDALFDCNEIKSRREKFEDKFAEFVDSHKRKEKDNKNNESLIISKYPTFSMLNRENLNEVMKLDESQKSKVAAYLNDSNFCTPVLVNENWKDGVSYEPEKEIWLKYAPATYKALFEKASETVKNSIRNTASYLLFENQYDINHFWENTGLMESEERRISNEKFINAMPQLNESAQNNNNNLPYSSEFVKWVKEAACEYND